MLDADFQRRCEGLHRRAQRSWGRQFLGRRRRLRVAGGTEATGVGDYTTGDELRYIDWNRCARHDELVTRQFMGTEDHAVYLLLDASRSMSVASAGKFDLARQLTAALGYLALANHDRVWAATYADGIIAQTSALRGRRAIPRLFRFLEDQSPSGASTQLERAIEQLTAFHTQRGLVILLSDMLDSGQFDVAVDSLRLRGFEPLLVHVLDESDIQPQALGKVKLTEIETGHARSERLNDRDLANYHDEFTRFCRRVRGYFHRYGLGVAPVTAGERVADCVERIVLGSVMRRHTRAGVR